MNIDKYINKLDLKIKQKNNKHINIKCPLCGDSTHNNFKARGYIYLSDEPNYFCYNDDCGHRSFYDFLKEQNPQLAKEYYKDIKLKDRKSINQAQQSNEKRDEIFGKTNIQDVIEQSKKEDVYNPLNLTYKKFDRAYYTTTRDNEQITYEKDIQDLNDECIEYLESRGFTKEDYKDFKYVLDQRDIIVPLWIDKSKNLVYGTQTRRLPPDKVFHNQIFNNPYKVTNLEYVLKLPKGSIIYSFEAEFDRISTSLKNSIAVFGKGASSDVLEILKDYKIVPCYDADDVGYTSTMSMAKKGCDVLVHKEEVNQFKDFNKMLELGMGKEDITNYILENIKSPKRAYMELKRRGYNG